MLRVPTTLLFATFLALGCSESSEPATDGGPTDATITPPDIGSSCTDDTCLCAETGGTWDEGSCGHYGCGMPPLCDALIPGCDCGAGRTFAEGIGCADDASCECSDAQCLCEATGGTWDDTACGHYVCGVPNDCRAIDPGCDCGDGSTFVAGAGCAADPGC